jgi:uncharacterized protein (DUF433 family)
MALRTGINVRSSGPDWERSVLEAARNVVHADPEIVSGTPVFVGTRVPFVTLVDYPAAGDTLAAFLDDFPSVSREQAVAALQIAQDVLLELALANARSPR